MTWVAASIWSDEALLGLLPVDKGLHVRSDVTPNRFQTFTVVGAVIMFFAIFVAWHMPILRDIIAGLKLFVVGTHELCHLIVGLLVGGQVVSVCIDPNDGGETRILNLLRTEPRMVRDPYTINTMAQLYWSPAAAATLAAGYIGSSIVGFLFIFASFDIVASKIASFIIGFGLLVPAFRADHWIAFASIIVCEAVMIGLWFGDHGNALRFYVLFLGVMNLFYVVWDYTDERFFDKRNSSDCSQFSELLGSSASGWAFFWFFIAGLVFTAAIFAGIGVFKKSPGEMYRDASSAVPLGLRSEASSKG